MVFNKREKTEKNRRPSKPRDEKEFDRKMISIRRVAKVNAGSKRLRISVMVVIGDHKGKIGIGLGRGADTKSAMDKAARYGMNHLSKIDLMGDTIPHEVMTKYGAAKLMIKPGGPGTGVIASAPVRAVMEVAGIRNVLTKQFGSNNKNANAYAAVKALKMLNKDRISERVALKRKSKLTNTKNDESKQSPKETKREKKS